MSAPSAATSPRPLTICSRRLVTGEPGAAPGPGTLRVADGRVLDVRPGVHADEPGAIDMGDLVVMPGVIDTHVHVNEPGRTEWEGFRSAGRAAAAGGVTTMVVMPLNCLPVAATRDALLAEARAAQASCLIDFGFWGGLVPGNAGDLRAMWDAGALGFKCFLSPSGIDDFPNVGREQLREAMPVLTSLAPSGAVLLVHAEDPDLLSAALPASGLDASPKRYSAFLASRPPECEVAAIRLMLELARAHGCRVHIVHVSAADALPLLRDARRSGVRVTAETCPHYLAFAAEDIPDGATLYKCAPPIRERANAEQLWDALAHGPLDLIASDHSPCPPELKRLDSGDFAGAWGGICGLQLTLPVVWTLARERGHGLERVSEWLSRAPARLAGIEHRKGRLSQGMDADFVVWDPEEVWRVRAADLHHRHKPTPYDGMTLRGRVHATFVRGRQVFGSPGSRSIGDIGGDGLLTGATGEWIMRER